MKVIIKEGSVVRLRESMRYGRVCGDIYRTQTNVMVRMVLHGSYGSYYALVNCRVKDLELF